jgi:hypothetical protein
MQLALRPAGSVIASCCRAKEDAPEPLELIAGTLACRHLSRQVSAHGDVPPRESVLTLTCAAFVTRRNSEAAICDRCLGGI